MNRLFLLLFGMVAFVAHAQVPDYVPTEGLVAWYPLAGNTENQVSDDYDGISFNGNFIDDRFGQPNSAAGQPGNQLLQLPLNPALLSNEFTISFWVYKRANIGHNAVQIAAPNGPGRVNFGFTSPNSNGSPYVSELTCQGTYGNCGYGNTSYSTPFNEWFHLAFVVNGMSSQIFLNGAEITLEYPCELLLDCDSPLMSFWFGGDVAGGAIEYFNGDFDDIGIWSGVLSEEEILALYNASAPAPGCTDPTACNFDAEAMSDDGGCIPSGCMEPLACNYNALAECEGEACDYTCCPGPGCCADGTSWDYGLGQCVPAGSNDANDESANSCPQDLDFDGVVGVGDLMDLLSVFGTNCPTNFTCGDPINYHGYDYATVQIGEQCWFAENLRNEQYANGDTIAANLTDGEWSSTTSGAVAVYGEDAGCGNHSPDGDACDPIWSLHEYGRLYNWHAVDDERGLCPTGWHVPTTGGWTILTDHLGGESVAGGQMKADYGWENDGNGTNSSGFAGLPGGMRAAGGFFYNAGMAGFWWTSSPNGSSGARYRDLNSSHEHVNNQVNSRRLGFSVRCLRDTE